MRKDCGSVDKRAVGIIAGLATGFFGGLLGMGGAFISIPAMITFMGLERHRAHATSLAVIAVSSALSGFYYRLHGNADLRLAGLLLAGSIVGVIAGAKIMHRIPVRELGIFFGLFIAVIALKMGLDLQFAPGPVNVNSADGGLIIVLVGAVTGCLSGLLGVGGAVLSIPALVYLAGVSQQAAQGTVLLATVPTAIIGSYTHWKHGYIDFTVAPWLILGTLFSSLGGAYLANIIPQASLKGIFSVLILLLGTQTAVSSISNKSREKGGKETQ